MTNYRQCSGATVLFTYVTGLHDPVVLRTKCLCLALGYIDDTKTSEFRQWYRVGLPQYF